MFRTLALWALLSAAACSSAPRALASSAPRVEHVVVISIDGLRPEFYLGRYDAPTLVRMAREGAHAVAVETVFPSVTYPSHATILTGRRPAAHGIFNNTLFGSDGTSPEGYWEAERFRCRTL
jgi:predicted AlkP superfamily pyrophosphatase or phosphodiesterase